VSYVTVVKYGCWVGTGCGEGAGNLKIREKEAPKWGPKNRVWGPPGRGVLQKSARAYRRPVHILPKNAVFSKNVPI